MSQCPWVKTYHGIVNRCTNKSIAGYRIYGGRGIKCLITKEELKILWERDGASKMSRPSIDRIDSAYHYKFENCRYIELGENVGRPNREKIYCVRGHLLSGDNIRMRKNYYTRVCKSCCRMHSLKWLHKKVGKKRAS